jgi:hypothetical protein
MADRAGVSGHVCANCRRPITTTTALATGTLCEKCKWATSSIEFFDDAPTRPRDVVPHTVLLRTY